MPCRNYLHCHFNDYIGHEVKVSDVELDKFGCDQSDRLGYFRAKHLGGRRKHIMLSRGVHGGQIVRAEYVQYHNNMSTFTISNKIVSNIGWDSCHKVANMWVFSPHVCVFFIYTDPANGYYFWFNMPAIRLSLLQCVDTKLFYNSEVKIGHNTGHNQSFLLRVCYYSDILSISLQTVLTGIVSSSHGRIKMAIGRMWLGPQHILLHPFTSKFGVTKRNYIITIKYYQKVSMNSEWTVWLLIAFIVLLFSSGLTLKFQSVLSHV